MVEIAPGSERLRIPVGKYLLFLFIILLLLIGLLWYLLSSNYGAQNSFLESLRRYLSFFSSYHPNLQPEDDFNTALRIHGFERDEARKFRLFVSVTDKDGSPVKVLNASDVKLKVVSNSGQDLDARIDRARPLHMYSEWAAPISFTSVMDYSGSMFPQDLTAIETNYSALINQISLPLSASVVKFNSRVHDILELSEDRQEIIAAIQKRIKLENTALFDGISRGIEKVQSRPHLRFIILTTDGNDNASTDSLESVIKRCQTHNIAVFVFGFGWLDIKNLRDISESTDGYYSYVPDSSKLDEWFQKIGQIINNVQVIEFSTNADMNQPGSVELSIDAAGQTMKRVRVWTQ
ncbi:MAG: VWA domain-containing protein [Candidatus Riflebacteria bacterium]|nr:VWA domain-containing protein [Candidatus Riflebacteria bacterium]